MFDNIVYLNRDIDVERRRQTEEQFVKHNVSAVRFSAIEDELATLALQSPSDLRINAAQLSCLVSHLEIIRKYGGSDLLVFEDDIDLSLLPKWPITLEELSLALPERVGVVQLTYFPSRGVLSPVRWMPGLFSTAAYFIKKEYAQKLVETGFKDGVWDISTMWSAYVQPLADSIIYSSTNTISLLMLGVRDEVSTILPHATYSNEVSKWAKEVWDTSPLSREQLLQQIRNFK